MNTDAIIHVVDDNRGMRQSLVLKTAGLNAQLYASAEEFLDDYTPAPPECMVLDLKLSGMSGIQLQEQVALRGIGMPIVFISGHGDIPVAVTAIKGGAVDFLEKPVNPPDLINRIRAGLEQDAQVSRHEREVSGFRARLATLSRREREVLGLVVAGKSSKQIAAEFYRSAKTIQLHRGRLMKKLDVGNVAQLVRQTIEADATFDS